LNSNPQYSDNSKAVPKNVPLNSWFFNKKNCMNYGCGLNIGRGCSSVSIPHKKDPNKRMKCGSVYMIGNRRSLFMRWTYWVNNRRFRNRNRKNNRMNSGFRIYNTRETR
jgi:hypothetical protein